MQKHPPNKLIAVDVDGTLIIDGQINILVVEFCRYMRDRDYQIMLWSSRGKQYAQDVAVRFEIADLFDDIIGKPGHILDDQGWEWTKYTRVVLM